jgi:hypothetical protein
VQLLIVLIAKIIDFLENFLFIQLFPMKNNKFIVVQNSSNTQSGVSRESKYEPYLVPALITIVFAMLFVGYKLYRSQKNNSKVTSAKTPVATTKPTPIKIPDFKSLESQLQELASLSSLYNHVVF